MLIAHAGKRARIFRKHTGTSTLQLAQLEAQLGDATLQQCMCTQYGNGWVVKAFLQAPQIHRITHRGQGPK